MSPEALRVAVQTLHAEVQSAAEWAEKAGENVEAAEAALALAIDLRNAAQERRERAFEAWSHLDAEEAVLMAQTADSGVVSEE